MDGECSLQNKKKAGHVRTVQFTNVKCKCEVLIVKTVRKNFNLEEKNKGKFWSVDRTRCCSEGATEVLVRNALNVKF